jgi:ribosomal protein S18 acetylase RimI-like enzyme
MQLELATQADERLFQAFQRLVPQLTQNNPPPTLEQLSALVRDPATTLVLARDEKDEIVGALSLAVYRVPTGIRSVIEDVIVDGSLRGRGIGEALMRRAVDLAREKGAAHISLTSNPLREAANRLYLRMGFKKRETNCYQLKLAQ